MEHNKRIEVSLLVFFCFAVATILTMYFKPYMIDNDASQATRTALHMNRGEGVSTSLLYYEEQQRNGIPAPQSIYPPGYPAVISVFLGLGVPVRSVAFASALFFQILGFIIFYLLLKHNKVTPLLTIFGLVIWIWSVPINVTVLRGISESTFVFFTFIAFLFYLRGLSKERLEGMYMLAAGGCAAAAFLIRYAGVSYIIALSVYLGVLFIVYRNLVWLWKGCLFSILPSISVALVFLRNFYLTGTLSGGPRVDYGSSVLEVIGKMLFSIKKLFGIQELYFLIKKTIGLYYLNIRNLLDVYGLYLIVKVILLAVLVVAGVWITLRFVKSDMIREFKKKRYRIYNKPIQSLKRFDIPPIIHLINTSMIYTFTTLAMLFYLGLGTGKNLVAPRYFAPLIPFLILTVLSILSRAIAISNRNTVKTIYSCIIVIGIIFFAGQYEYGKWEAGLLNRIVGQKGIYYTLKKRGLKSGENLLESIKRLTSDGSAIMEADGQFLGHLLNRPAVGMSYSDYTRRIWNELEVKALIARYKVSYILIFPQVFDYETSKGRNKNRPFLIDLEKGNVPDWLEVTRETETYKIFKIDRVKL
jgi:hypothetical protein